MNPNKEKITEEQKLEKLRRISFGKKDEKKISVYSPAELCQVGHDLLLLGFRHEDPLAFNVVDFLPAIAGAEGKFPFFIKTGAVFAGFYLCEPTLKTINEKTGLELPGSFTENPSIANEAILERFSGFDDISKDDYIVGYCQEGQSQFFYFHEGVFLPCISESYTLSLDVFSRNTGILETTMMRSKTAIISGCGSVGSYVALELARGGVGSFLLIDSDVISYANVCRHQCGIADVGRYKTNAVADRIRLINPEARIEVQNCLVENVNPAVFAQYCGTDSVIVGCADNRQGDLFACKVAASYNMPMVSIGFWERAFAGEVFYWIPERPGLACYQCFTQALGDISGRQSVNRRYYTSQIDLSKVNFMPGISVDISFVTNVGIKIILDILNRNVANYVPRLVDSLTQFTLIANTHKKEIGGDLAALFSYPLQVTTSIEVEKMKDCKICNKSDQDGNRT